MAKALLSPDVRGDDGVGLGGDDQSGIAVEVLKRFSAIPAGINEGCIA
jgi:hypothetical protein